MPAISLPAFSQTTIATNYETILVGLLVNDKEVATIDALEQGDKKYLPLDLVIKQLGLTPAKKNNQWLFHSPIGDAAISQSAVLNYQGQDYVPLNMFKPLGVNAVYDQSLLAIKLYIPWDNKKPFAKTSKQTDARKTMAADTKLIEYYPKTFGLGGIRISGGVNRANTQEQKNNSKTENDDQKTRIDAFSTQVGLTGYLAGGLWGTNLQYNKVKNRHTGDDSFNTVNTGDPFYLSNLYWVKSGEHWATRFGTNSSSYALGTDDYTGLTVAYSNKNIKKHLAYSDDSTSQLLATNNTSSRRTIKGTGPAGGIAELRVNGRAIARARIALDKKYEFIGLDIDRYDNGSDVEVAIYEYSLAEPPIRTDKPYLSTRRSNVDTGELLVEAGSGRLGNSFDRDKDYDNAGSVAHGYAEYGLTNNVAIRAAVSKDSDDETANTMVGVNVGLPFRINMDLSYESIDNEKHYNGYLDYNSKYIGISYNYQHRRYGGDNINAHQVKKSDEQYLNINVKPTERIALGLYGVQKKADDKPTEKYFTANLNARLHDNLSININKDRYNDYRYGAYWNIPQWQARINADWNKNMQSFKVSKQLTEFLDVGTSVTKWKDVNENAYYAYADYKYNNKHRFHLGVGRYGEQNGYDVNWKYQHNNYASLSLGYKKNQSTFDRSIDSSNPIFNDSDYFYLQFDLSLVNTENNGFEYGRYRPSYYGTVINNVYVDDTDSVKLDDRIKVRINDYSVDAYKVAENQYRIDNVKPGIYEYEFPVSNLPLDYQSKKMKKSVIKVAEASPTVINYQLGKSFGVSGQLTTEKDGVLISVYQGGKKIDETRTTAYGYYQFIGLPAGSYTLKSEDGRQKKIKLTDDFLFEVKL